MADAPVKLIIDKVNRWAIQSLTKPDILTYDEVFQGERTNYQIYIAEPSYSEPPYVLVAIDNLTLYFVVGKRFGSEEILVAQYTWSKDTTNRFFYAEVNYNTSELNTKVDALTTDTYYSTYLEILLGDSGIYRPIYQKILKVNPVVKTPGAALAAPAANLTPLTLEDANNLFLKKISAPGDTWTAYSPDGTRGRVLGIRNDGSKQDDVL